MEELEVYAKAKSVSDFYYSMSASLNGESIDAINMSENMQDDKQNAGSSQLGLLKVEISECREILQLQGIVQILL